MSMIDLLRQLLKTLLCKHDYKFIRNIYSDEIVCLGWKRSEWKCSKCGNTKFEKEYVENSLICDDRITKKKE